MKITSSTRLIHLSTQKYPFFLSDVAQKFPTISLPIEAAPEQIALLGYAPVVEAVAPEGDVVTELAPVLEDGVWKQNWSARSFTPLELTQKLQEYKELALADVNTARSTAFANGIIYTFPDGSIDGIQLRPEDRINLLGLRLEAMTLLQFSDTETLSEFRTINNVTKFLNAEQMVNMTNVALARFKRIMSSSWAAKEAIERAETCDGVDLAKTLFTV